MNTTNEPLITVKNLTIAYGDYIVQQNLNFTINKQDIFIIMGPSGCGKSTLLQAMVGLHMPSLGQIFYNKIDFWALTEEKRLELLHNIGLLFQSGALWTSMTLAENIALPLERYTKLSTTEIQEQVSLKLSLVGLSGFENYYPSELSGGMKKRAGLARALAIDPKIVFFDEPSAGLDPISAGMLDELILELTKNLTMTVIIVTHDLDTILSIGTNSIFLDTTTHTMLAQGDPKKLKENMQQPEIVRFFSRGKQPTQHNVGLHYE